MCNVCRARARVCMLEPVFSCSGLLKALHLRCFILFRVKDLQLDAQTKCDISLFIAVTPETFVVNRSQNQSAGFFPCESSILLSERH